MMYHPTAVTADEIARGYTGNSAEDFEYIEIKNIGTTTLPLAGLRFDKASRFTFPNVPWREPVTFWSSHQAAFHIATSVSTSLIAGQYSGHLDNAGEKSGWTRRTAASCRISPTMTNGMARPMATAFH